VSLPKRNPGVRTTGGARGTGELWSWAASGQAALPLKITVYRLQEALNNAFRHAEGKEQRVRAWSERINWW
jgi:hypothetical protein